MLKLATKIIFFLITVFTLFKCIDPYIPNLKGYDSLLVVDALITNANTSYIVKLSRTFQEQNTTPGVVSDATVSISDDQGNKSYLNNLNNGIYKTDSLEFRGSVGRTYTLHILTNEGEEYESDPCLMQSVAEIDSIYIERDQRLISNETETEDGVGIYLASKEGDNDQYYRWTFDETWKFKVPDPKKFDYIHSAYPNAPVISPVTDIKEFCWKSGKSDEILIRSINEGQSKKIMKQPIFFIATEKTDRLLLQYSILVKQYSISKNEYEFWNNLIKVNETGNDIFARQPYTVISNIHSTNNVKKRVLGFFQVSAVTQKRKNIPYRDVALMGLHFYSYPCRTWEFAPGDFETLCRCPPKTWDDVYWYLCIVSDYTFTQPKYFGYGDSLVELEFTRPECANCELTGSHIKPDFWDAFQ